MISFCQEARERKARRAKRFGLQQKSKDVKKTEESSDQEANTEYVPYS